MNLLDLFFPKQCSGCSKLGAYLCADCTREILQGELICAYCRRPSNGGLTHPSCRKRFGLDGLWSLGLYQPPLSRVIQKLKYRFIKSASQELTSLMLRYWAEFSPLLLEEIGKDRGEEWLVTVVPLHWKRQNWRGFNQSSLMAKEFADKLGLPFVEVLVREKETAQQARLDRKQRQSNVFNVFAVLEPAKIESKKIILFDDVWTTGATMRECTYQLKKAKAHLVWGVTIAR